MRHVDGYRSEVVARGISVRARALTITIVVLFASFGVLASSAVAQAVSLASMAGQLGVSAGRLQQIRQRISEGPLSSGEMDRLCAGANAKDLGAAQMAEIGSALGLSQGDIAQLQACAQHTSNSSSGGGRSVGGPGPVADSAPSSHPWTSSIEVQFRELDTPYKLYAAPSLKNLTQFGYSLFSSPVSTFAPISDVPVSDQYVLGPGDGLNIILWGRINNTISLKVQRDGTILLPQVGPMDVAGLTFAQAKKLIEERENQITGVHAAVTMGQVRSIQVFVIGKVNHPGLYTISALSHVSNALVAAGGISKMGSLRRIELRKGNQVLEHLDLYNMLLRGNTSGDAQLQSREVIFVPVIGPVVGVVGDVKSPAIYELKGRTTIDDVLRMAGGVTAFGYSERVQVERVQNHQRRIALDVNLRSPQARHFLVHDGDLIKIYTVLPQQHDVVRIKGNVAQPGTYGWYRGMRVSDLVREAQGLSAHTFYRYALIRRTDNPRRSLRLIRFNLNRALSRESSSDPLLEPRDAVTIYSQNEVHGSPTVAVFGYVRRAGTYAYTQGMNVNDLILEAGGFRRGADRTRAELMRSTVGRNSVARYVQMSIRFADGDKVPLKPGDELFVESASNWHAPWVVTIEGQVERPGPYPMFAGERLSSLLQQCGGFRPNAYLPAAVFIRHSVRKLQQEQLNQARIRLKQEIARLSLAPQQLGQTRNANMANALAMMEGALSQTSSQQAVGRVVIHLSSLDRLERSPDNVVLENGDKLVIPTRPGSVQVLGQVYSPNAIVYQPGLTVQDYLQHAGGPTESANVKHIYVIRADGSILTEQGLLDSGKNRIFPLLPIISDDDNLMTMPLKPGDTIYVPEKLVYVSGLQYAREITQIMANSAISIATLGILASNL